MNEPKSKTPGHGQRAEILVYVVDDEPLLLELASVILEPAGYTVETFRSPDSALRSFEAAEPKPALIITDYTMKAMSGLELAAACRRLRPEQKVLLLSGTVGPEALQNVSVEPDRFLAKPYQAEQLIDVVKSMVGN